MRFLLVGPDLESNLSLGYLASALRGAGHEAETVSFNDGGDVRDVVRRARDADAIGLSMSFQVRAPEFLALASALKRAAPKKPILAGGHFATCAAEELLRDFSSLDLIVQHEGEDAIVELANLGDEMLTNASTVLGVVVRGEDRIPKATPKRPALRDLDRLPLPDRSGPARLIAGVPTAYFMGSRGCIRNCDYCCITTLHRLAPGPRFRQRDPKNVVAEMSALYHERGVRQFVFHDDNFLVPSPKENAYRLGLYEDALRAAKLDDIGIVMKCGPQDLDERALQKLIELGLLRIFLGIESGSQCGLDSIGRRQTCNDTERAVSLCEKYGVSSQYTMIIFNPDATIASMLADLDFVERHPAHPLNYCRAEIYAGTPLERRMIAAGAAEGTYMARTYRYADPKVARVWDLGRDLFAGRCWGEDEMLGHAIRLDHQATVLRHFYDGAEIDALVSDFYGWERRLNLETAGFFRELVLACDAAHADDAPELLRAIADLRVRERAARASHRAELCDLRRRISEAVQPVIDHASAARNEQLGFAETPVSPRAPRTALPRHAMAVVVAALMGCGTRMDNGVVEAPPPPLGTPYTAAPPTSSDPDAGVPTTSFATPPPPPWMRPDDGVAEAAPPPIDRNKGGGL